MNMTDNIQKLVDLAKEHPDLPIVAMVDGEIVGGDDYVVRQRRKCGTRRICTV